MKQIDEIINAIKLPESKLILTEVSESAIQIEPISGLIIDIEESHLKTLVKAELRKAVVLLADGTWHIDRQLINRGIFNVALSALEWSWCAVNKKSEFNRTKLSRILKKVRHNNSAFQEKIISLYLDSYQHDKTFTHNRKITSVTKFIANQFQVIVEAECPK